MKRLLLAGLFSLAATSFATLVPKGTDVRLAFEQDVSSKTARIGDKLNFHVVDDVLVDGQVVIKKGTAATGTVQEVHRGRHFGVNAVIRVRLDAIAASDGTMLPIAARYKGKKTGGSMDKAAIASGAGAVFLGPVGLGIGYFMTGKDISVRSGDTMMSEVSKATDVNVSAAPSGVLHAGQSAGGS